jgi:hypothetical protein
LTVGLFIAGVLVFAMVVAGVWLMEHAQAEPAARAVGEAPDPAEEEDASRSAVPRSSILAEEGRDRPPAS